MSEVDTAAKVTAEIAGAIRRTQSQHLEDSVRRLAVRNKLLAPPRQRRGKFAWPVAALVGTACVAALVFAGMQSSEPRVLTYEADGVPQTPGDFVSARSDEAVDLAFSDGSTVRLTAGASGRVERLDDRGAEMRVENGTAVVDVVHESDTRWRFSAGPYTVHVIGTRFSVGWDARERTFELSMDEGEVRVEGPDLDGPQTLVAGEELRMEGAPIVAAAAEPAQESVSQPAIARVADGSNPEPRETDRASEAPGPRTELRPASAPVPAAVEVDWATLAQEARDDEAIAMVDALGFDQVTSGETSSRLLLLAGSLRRRSDARAVATYETVRRRFARTPQAAEAAFHLGRSWSVAGDLPGAATSFHNYLNEQPNGRWAAEASGRLLEALHRSGRSDEAQIQAQRYLERHPTGSYAQFARNLVTPAANQAADPADSVP